MIRQAGCVVAVAAVLAVGGCTKDDPTLPTTSTTSSTSVGSGTTTSSATSSSPKTTSATYPADLPEAAKAHTREGAIAMAKYFLISSDESLVSLDSSAVKAVSADSCIGCSNVIKHVQTNKDKGWRQSQTSSSIAAVLPATPDQSQKSTQQVDLLIDVRAFDYLDSTGKVVEHDAAAKYTLRLLLSWQRGGWLVQAAGAVNL